MNFLDTHRRLRELDNMANRLNKTNSNLAKTIDALGELKAQIADLKTQYDNLKGNFDEFEPGAYEGDLFRLNIEECTVKTLDVKALKLKLTPRMIKAYTRESLRRRVEVTARSGKGVSDE